MVIRNRNNTTKQDLTKVSTVVTKPKINIKKDISKILKEVVEFPVIDDIMVKKMKPKLRGRYIELLDLDYETIKKHKCEDLYHECLNYLEILKVKVGMVINEEHYNMMSYKMSEKYKSLKGLNFNSQILKNRSLLDLYRKCIAYIRSVLTNKNYYEKNKDKLKDKYREVYRAKMKISNMDEPISI